MSSIDAAISELYEKYESKIRKHIYGDFLKRYDLQEDVVNEVFSIFLERARNRGNIEEAIDKFPVKLKYFILEAIRTVIKKQRGDIKLVSVESIKDFYEKVQRVVQEGYSEEEAKNLVRIEESILRYRIYVIRIPKAAIGGGRGTEGSTNDDKNRDDLYDIVKKIDPYQTRTKETEMIDKEEIGLSAIAFVICLEKLKIRESRNSERDYRILRNHLLLETSKTHLARRYDLTYHRVRQIIGNGKGVIARCIKNELRKRYH